MTGKVSIITEFHNYHRMLYVLVLGVLCGKCSGNSSLTVLKGLKQRFLVFSCLQFFLVTYHTIKFNTLKTHTTLYHRIHHTMFNIILGQLKPFYSIFTGRASIIDLLALVASD